MTKKATEAAAQPKKKAATKKAPPPPAAAESQPAAAPPAGEEPEESMELRLRGLLVDYPVQQIITELASYCRQQARYAHDLQQPTWGDQWVRAARLLDEAAEVTSR